MGEHDTTPATPAEPRTQRRIPGGRPTAAQARFLAALPVDGSPSRDGMQAVSTHAPINAAIARGWTTQEPWGDGTGRVQHRITSDGLWAIGRESEAAALRSVELAAAADRARTADRFADGLAAARGAAEVAAPHTDPVAAEGWGEANEEGPESRDCVRVYVQSVAGGGRVQWCATHRTFEPIEDDDQGATVAAREGDDMGKTETPAGPDPVAGGAADELLRLVLLGRDARLNVRPKLRQYATLAEMQAALAAPGAAATLRAIADQVERDQAGHVTDILPPDGAGHFAWRCVQGDAEGTGYEIGEEAYKAATAHGRLVADSLFARGPVIEHEGRGDNEHGVSRRTLGGSLRWESHDGGFWFLSGYASADEVDEDDIIGAQAWAAGVMAAEPGGQAVTVVRWEYHRDDHGDWWEPVTR